MRLAAPNKRDMATTAIYADYSESAHEAEWVEAGFARESTVSVEAVAS